MMDDGNLAGSKILLAEDEASMARGLVYNLEEEGFLVTHVADGRQALKELATQEFDLVLLDIMLPFHDGFEVAQAIRTNQPRLPILMLTAKTDIQDRVRGLEIGANDYMTKPFHLDELLARIRGILHRKMWYARASQRLPSISFGENSVNFLDYACRAGNKQFQLTAYEAMMLQYMAERAGTIVTRKELLENVWHTNPEIETRTVDNFIVRLRKYFEPNPNHPIYFKSVRGAGYMFTIPQQ